MAARACRKEKEIAILQEKITNINEKMEDIHKALMGNHKPGLIDEFSQWKGALRFVKYVGSLLAATFAACIGILMRKVF